MSGVEPQAMLGLLLAVALIGVIAVTLLLAGALVAAVIGVLVFNAFLVMLTLRRRPRLDEPDRRIERERWQPSAFRRPPTVAAEPPPAPGDEPAPLPTIRVHRL